MDKEVEKTQGEKYARKRDKVAEEVQTVRYTLRKFLELTRKSFEADNCYLYQVNTEMDEDEKKECIRKRVEHIKDVYEKRGEIYPNELENAKNNPNRVKILNFVDLSQNEKVWDLDSSNPEKYVVFDKCTNNYKGTIGDGLKATIEADKIYFDAVDSVTSNESRSDINISIFEEGLNGYIARTKKIVIFSSDKAISRHSSSASYNVKKGITPRCEMMIGFPLIDEDKSVIGILKIEKYIMNYDMGEDNYKFDKLKIDQRIEDVKKYLPLFVKFIKSSKEEFDTNSYEKLLRGIELLNDLKKIEPVILKDVLIRLLKSLDDFFSAKSCKKLSTTMELLGSLDKVDLELLQKIETLELGLSEKLQDIELDSVGNIAEVKKCPKEIEKEICRLLEYLRRIKSYERTRKDISILLKSEKIGDQKSKVIQLLGELNKNELKNLGNIETNLIEIKNRVEYSYKIYANMDVLHNLDDLNNKLNDLLNNLEKIKKDESKESEIGDYTLQFIRDNLELIQSINKVGNELKETQERTKNFKEFYVEAAILLEESLENLNDEIVYLKDIIHKFESIKIEERDFNEIYDYFDLISNLLIELKRRDDTSGSICNLVQSLRKKEQYSKIIDQIGTDNYFLKNIKRLEELAEKENELKRKQELLSENLRDFEPENGIYRKNQDILEILDEEIINLEEVNYVLSITIGGAKCSSEIYEEINILLSNLTILEIFEEIEPRSLDSTEKNTYCGQSCKNDIKLKDLKETLKINCEYSDKIRFTLKEANNIIEYSNEIDKVLKRKTMEEIYDDFNKIQKIVRKQKDFQHKLLKNPIKIKCNEQFCEELSHLLENLETIEKQRQTTDKIKIKLDDFKRDEYFFEYNKEVYDLLKDLSNIEINNLLKYLRVIRPIILENIKGIKDDVKVIRDICDGNLSEKIHRSICPEQINKEIYDLTLDLFFDFKRKERIGYDEISNEISMYMNQISKLLNLDADMTRSYKDILEGVRKHEELLLCGLDDYRDHFVHQFHVFISGYIIINELGFDFFIPNLIKNREYVLGKQKDSYELSKSDILRIWFLTASYHDYAYILEKIEVELESFFKEFLGYSFKIEFDWKSLLTTNTEFTNYLINFVKFFDSERGTKQDVIRRQDILRRNYLDSIITKHDHGVLSALLLTNYTEGLKEKRYYEYMCAALAISLHNEPIFKNFTENNKIWFESFPIAFLLAYCDTAQTFGRLEGKEHVESSKYPIKFSGIRVEKNKNKSMQKPRIVYKLEYLCEQLNKNPTEDKIKIWAKNVNNVFQSEDCHFEIEYCKKGREDPICTLSFY